MLTTIMSSNRANEYSALFIKHGYNLRSAIELLAPLCWKAQVTVTQVISLQSNSFAAF